MSNIVRLRKIKELLKEDGPMFTQEIVEWINHNTKYGITPHCCGSMLGRDENFNRIDYHFRLGTLWELNQKNTISLSHKLYCSDCGIRISSQTKRKTTYCHSCVKR